jgi:hypothetical protein
MLQAAKQAGIDVNWDTTSRPMSYPDGILTKHFDIITPVLEANGLFNRFVQQLVVPIDSTILTGAKK